MEAKNHYTRLLNYLRAKYPNRAATREECRAAMVVISADYRRNYYG